uniref:Uncharacterized protein n=1 Tax=Rhabditophanes sp. KR3021 TaxID=114890 RepID=A0AC35UAK5_9BILA
MEPKKLKPDEEVESNAVNALTNETMSLLFLTLLRSGSMAMDIKLDETPHPNQTSLTNFSITIDAKTIEPTQHEPDIESLSKTSIRKKIIHCPQHKNMRGCNTTSSIRHVKEDQGNSIVNEDFVIFLKTINDHKDCGDSKNCRERRFKIPSKIVLINREKGLEFLSYWLQIHDLMDAINFFSNGTPHYFITLTRSTIMNFDWPDFHKRNVYNAIKNIRDRIASYVVLSNGFEDPETFVENGYTLLRLTVQPQIPDSQDVKLLICLTSQMVGGIIRAFRSKDPFFGCPQYQKHTCTLMLMVIYFLKKSKYYPSHTV